jgi:Glycosyl transferase family 2
MAGRRRPPRPRGTSSDLAPVRAGDAYPSVSVVIPTRGGRARAIGRSLGTLLSDPATAEVIVVLDHEDAETEAMLREHARSDSRVHVERPPREVDPVLDREQLARDTGAELARGEVILALDDDVEPRPGLVTGHASRHFGQPDLVVVGYTPVRAREASREPEPASLLLSRGYERACAAFLEDPDNVLKGLWGGHLSMRKETWISASRNRRRVGAGYHVDQEFGLQLLAAGARGVFAPELEADHRHVGSAATVLQTARSSGFGQARLHGAHPQEVRDPERVLAEGSRLARPFLSVAHHRLAWLALTGAAGAVARAAHRCRLRRAEYVALLALQRLGFALGAREGAQPPGDSSPRLETPAQPLR